jgi:Protein of unknown function (DUF2510)
MLHYAHQPFWRRHPVLTGAAAFAVCWLLVNGWYGTVAVATAGVLLIVIRRTRRMRARRDAALRARADYEHRLTQCGDQRGIFGRFPPLQPGWFADPYRLARLRYFDGATWTGHTTAG